MKIVVVGSGGVGGYFGGLLAHSGQAVTFIARGAHLEAIRSRGLRVKSVHGDFEVSPAVATDDMGAVAPADFVLVCVKDFQLNPVIPEMQSMVGPQTVVIPLLNGIRAADRLVEAFGRDKVLGGLCSVVAFIAEPGLIRQASPFRQITFGEWDGRSTARARRIRDILRASGADVELTSDILKAMWTKFLFITAYSGVASVVRLPAADLHACPETMALVRQAMTEIASVARSKGVALDKDIVEQTISFVAGLPPEATASMQRDVQAGRMFELEALTGSLVRAGAEVGIPTPVNSFIYAALKPQELRVRGGR